MEPIERVEQYVTSTGVIIKDDQSRASFSPMDDYISMPSKNVFFDNGETATENYYAVLLHELTHWTGGSTRLDREQVGKAADTAKYTFEELIAELGSAFLCSQFTIKQHGREDHAIYLKSWLQALKNDKKYILKQHHRHKKPLTTSTNSATEADYRQGAQQCAPWYFID